LFIQPNSTAGLMIQYQSPALNSHIIKPVFLVKVSVRKDKLVYQYGEMPDEQHRKTAEGES
jgi:hypothetical protein